MPSEDDPHVLTQQVFAWSGLILAGTFFIGFWVIAGFVPPSNPQGSVVSIVHFYSSNTTAIHIGLWLTMMGAACCVPFFTVIGVQMRRIEGKHSPLSYAQMLFGALFTIEFIYPLMFWQAADYRATLDPVLTYRLHDIGWLLFLGVVSTGALQAIFIGIIILRDKRTLPSMPRWLGYLSIWVGILFCPGSFIVFFKSGPLDWRGLVAWWFVVVAFAVWVIALVWALVYRAIPDQREEWSRRHTAEQSMAAGDG